MPNGEIKPYPIIEVPADAPHTDEQMGSKGKFWYEDASLGPCLYKQGRPTNA